MRSIIKGNIIEARRSDALTVTPGGCIVLDDGVIEGVYGQVPATEAGVPVTDYGERMVLQSFCDMHLHAPQYAMLGTGMDLPLLEWLEAYAFPTEEKFSDLDTARRIYRRLAAELIENGTTRVCMFSSVHTDATLVLMEELERVGVTGYVGKVNMDRNCPDGVREPTQTAKAETLRWLDACERFSGVRPILTPRFTPACTDELMAWLGALAQERGLFVQSHLSENRAEMEWVRQLHPDCRQYWQTYDKYGLWKQNTIMAHCVYSDETERAAMRDSGVLTAHCPDSNVNICSGFAPVRTMLDEGVWVALGSDIAGGAQLSMLDVMTGCIRTSKVRRVESNWETPFLTVPEAYYLATTSGARYFGAGAGFAKGDPLHAVVVDDSAFPSVASLTLPERFERAVYRADARQIVAVYSNGKRVK